MDPLSIASTVVALTATCLSTCKKLSDLAGSYEDVPVVIAMLCSESTVISCALSQLQILVLQRDDLAQAWATKTDVLDAFEMSLNGCMIVFSCLEAETRQLQTQASGSTGQKFWTKIKFMWNQDRLKELLTALRGQQMSINFLLQVLECKTLSDIQKNVQSNQSRIRASRSDAESVRSRNPSVRISCASVFDNDTHRLSMFADDLVSVAAAPSELDFEFDNFVINSQAYRRVFAKAQAQSTQQMQVQNITYDLIDLSDEVQDNADAATDRGVHQDLAGLDLSQRSESVSIRQNSPPSTPAIPRKPVSNLELPSAPSLRTSSPAADRPAGPRTCYKCHEVLAGQFVRALNHTWHLECFTCADCGTATALKFFANPDDADAPLCVTDFFRRLDLLCFKCGQALRGNYITAEGKKFHVEHFTCEECDTQFGPEDSYYEHHGHIVCFSHYCRKYASHCTSCKWPILKQFVEFEQGTMAGVWHPECFLLRKHFNITIMPWSTRQCVDLLQHDSSDDTAIKAYSDKLEVMIKHTWEWTSMFLEALTKEATMVQDRCARKKLDPAFRHWNAMTALLNSLLAAVHQALGAVSDEDLQLLRSRFDPNQQSFLSQITSNMELPNAVSAAVGPLLQRTLLKLLEDDEWMQVDSRLDIFLCRLQNAQQLTPLPQYFRRLPTAADEASLLCTVCSQALKQAAYVLGTNTDPGRRKWHGECWACSFCSAGWERQKVDGVQADTGPSLKMNCASCERSSVVKRMENWELLVESIWASWARVRIQVEASRAPRLPELPFR